MFIPFIVYLVIVVTILGVLFSKKFRKWFILIIVCSALVAVILSLHGIARAEQPGEVRTCWITPFTYRNFAIGTFTVVDEDGYTWDFYLGEGSYVVDEEHTLHLPVDEDPWLEYDLLYSEAEYHVSWYNTTKHRFEEMIFAKLEDAETEFNSKKANDIPVRLTECMLGSHRIHEVKAACQHWYLGMGNYLEQMAKGTLPVGEIPYAFHNSYLTSELKVDNGNGYLYFRVGFDEYSVQISRGCNGISILTGPSYEMKITSHVIVERNPILDPWIARIERQW